MTAAHLVRKLQGLITEHGDCPVFNVDGGLMVDVEFDMLGNGTIFTLLFDEED